MFQTVYKWTLSVDGNQTETQVFPHYSNEMKKEYTREDGQMFFREKLNGNLKFFNGDFDMLEALPIDTMVCVNLYISYDYGQNWQKYANTHFYKTDAVWNYDDKIVETPLTTTDEYNDILEGLNNEYNLIELHPNLTTLKYKRRYAFQFYQRSASYYGMSYGGMYWEQETAGIDYSEFSDGTVNNTWYIDGQFFPVAVACQIDVDIPMLLASALGLNEVAVNQTYNGGTADENHLIRGYAGDLYCENFSTYYIQTNFYLSGTGTNQHGNFVVMLRESSTDRLVMQWTKTYQGVDWMLGSMPDILELSNGVANGTTYQNARITVRHSFTYMRVVTSVNTANTLPCDVLQPSTNYPFTWAMYTNSQGKQQIFNQLIYLRNLLLSMVAVSFGKSIDATQYGRDDNGMYWTKPHSGLVPIARNSWRFCSLWFQPQQLQDLEQMFNADIVCRDSYTLDSCISVLLRKIGTGITFSATSECSQFLYGNTPIKQDNWKAVITPLTNILVADYDTPAKKAPITLGKIFDMLRDVFRCYWYVDGDKKLHIEHEYYYKNGGNYNGVQITGFDLTNQRNVRNGKNYGFGQNTVKYNKPAMPERYQYGWCDTASTPFDGLPIEVRSKFVTKGEIEQISVGGFYSDLDYALLNADYLTQDGFFLTLTDGNGNVPIGNVSDNEYTYTLQNVFASFMDLQPKYHLFDMPAKNLVVNGFETTANGISRNKLQEVRMPMPNTLDLKKTIKTAIGYGNIRNIVVDLEGRFGVFTLEFDTEKI